LNAINTKHAEHISGILCQSLVVSDEVKAKATRLTQLVKLLPVAVEWSTSSWVNDVLNKLPECHGAGLLRVRAIFPPDVGSNSPIIPTVPANIPVCFCAHKYNDA